MRLALFYNPSPGTIGDYFHRAFTDLGHQVDHFSTVSAEQCPGGYQLHLRIDHGDYACDLPRRLRPAGFYVVDTHLAHAWRSIQRQATWYDKVFCAQRQAAQQLRRAVWVPLACDPQVHRGTGQPVRYDVAFVGNDGGVPRKLYLQELRERYPNSFIGRAPHTQMASMYSQAKIGFHYIERTSPLKDHVSMRVYEILAAGRLLLTNALGDGDYELLGFHDRQELVVYHTPQELFQLLAYYLQHDQERERIAAAGQACVLQHHTYRQRAQQIVLTIEKESRPLA